MSKALVIVESPTKAKTLAKFLAKGYVVESSIGHIRDLPESAKEIPAAIKKEPWGRLAIDVDHGFRPVYVIPAGKREHVNKLKALLKDADTLYLATDEDREGESISWHLREVLKPKVPVKRMVFHEITREAVLSALDHPRDIDERLVAAQETRRVLDRLYGYEVSPVLWRKIASGLSAGRVQSVAVKLIVERERERRAFHAASFWDLLGAFAAPAEAEFEAELISVDGARLVSGKDFDPATGKPQEGKAGLVHLDAAAVRALQSRLEGASWAVTKVEAKPYTQAPPAPFTTSTLQQEANRKHGWASGATMRTAQALYERGYITYMRTDSTTLSEQAVGAARRQIEALYGKEFVPPEPRVYRGTVKNAQEAHEAIRPAGEEFRLPEDLRGELDERELRLYDMIWKRAVASQMPNARGQRIAVQAEGRAGDQAALFQATGKTIEFPGFLRAYVEGSDDPDAELEDKERLLPPLQAGQRLECRSLKPVEHVTQPPARFSEAALIKELEKDGIGRPSTYASIIDTIIRREYVFKKGTALVPSFTAFAVVQLLERHFAHLVDVDFTARMEDVLDGISRGEGESLPYLKEFYFGSAKLAGLKDMIKAEIDPRQACTLPLGADSQGRVINVRVGKFGPYLERGDDRASIPVAMAPDELTLPVAEDLLLKGNAPGDLGADPASGKMVYVKTGRFGPYVQLGEADGDRKMKSLLPGQSPETLTLEQALQLLSLPRDVGVDAATGETIRADLGRYGPYLRKGEDSRSLPAPEALFTVTLDEAQAIFAKPKSFRRGQPTVLRELGKHPASGATLNLLQGRYGPYVTDGAINASLPRTTAPEALTLAEAATLIDNRAAAGPPRRGRVKAAKIPKAPKTPKVAAGAPKSASPARVKASVGGAAKGMGKGAGKAPAKPDAPGTSPGSPAPRQPTLRKGRRASG
jgi:DNA topoisomerase-1